MDTDYKIIDNFLSEDDHFAIKISLTETNITPWFISNEISHADVNTDLFYMTHKIYDDNIVTSDYYNTIMSPILSKLNHKALIRIKCNLYPKTDNIREHNQHIDYPFEHLGALYFVNTNNGYTILHDGTKVESVENRMLFFKPNLNHNSTTCSDEKYRITINFNYF